MTPTEYIRPLYAFLFLAGGAAPATREHGFWRAMSGIVAGATRASRGRLSRPAPFPADDGLRDDIGLPPLAEGAPTLQPRLTPAAPGYFPTDDRLRNDIGLPPLGHAHSE